ncbi:putative ABC transporter permease [Oceanirhabdus sp. W0125-5]|uniref:putative ABC transporter permease n=1 Tax=Oceanirhabdus sp. W0125-5 TaxID=2999116 RepID=UPI0022F31F4A|nr:hypothetical protein [Oceanirhabdus sp. W0125-5]WBW96757.1 hypothetical protein OW730_24155 [Oceanirhabdus sp. W0125-5]
MRFIIYGLVGWCAEVIWNGVRSLIAGDFLLVGWTSMWMFPIYGLMIFLEPIHNRIRNFPLIIRGGIYTVLIFFVEFLTGLVLSIILGTCPWDYTDSPLSVCGVIRLDFIPVWFIGGLLFEKLHDILESINFTNKTV